MPAPASSKFLSARPLRLFYGVLLALLLAACTDAKFTQTPTAQSFPPWEGEVQVLEQMPRGGSFDRVGVVVVTGPEYISDERLRKRLLDQAADQGANAIVYQGKSC